MKKNIKTLCIHQPNFFPRLKVLQKITHSDFYVILDNVQYSKNEWQNRTKILIDSQNFKAHYLTLPVSLPYGSKTQINEVRVLRTEMTLMKIQKTIYQEFRQSRYWSDISEFWDEFISIINLETGNLIDLTIPSVLLALKNFGILPDYSLSSSLNCDNYTNSSKRIESLCTLLDAEQYIADSGSLNYLNVHVFKNTKIIWQKWDCKYDNENYLYRDLSFLCFLAKEGKESLREHLYNGIFV